MVLDAFAEASNIHFEDKRYGFIAETSLKGRKIILLKPTTFMNLSGNAVRYWLTKENIDQSRLLVISDELALRSEEHTSELQSRQYLVCRLLLEKKKIT